MAIYTEKQIQAVWNQAETIPGKDPQKYRKDPYGLTIKFSKYGDETGMGWEIEHIVPEEYYKDVEMWNLQAVQSAVSARQKYSPDKKTRYGISARQLVKMMLSKLAPKSRHTF